MTPVQTLLQTFYFAFVGLFGRPHLYRCIDKRINKKLGSRRPENHWMNRYFPPDSFPIRMDTVHLEADIMDDPERANFKLRVPAEIMKELRFENSPLTSFAKITSDSRCMTIEVKGQTLLNNLYFSIVSWMNKQLKSNSLRGDTEQVTRLIYHYYGLEKAPVPQPVPAPTGKKAIKVRFAEKTNRGNSRPNIRLIK